MSFIITFRISEQKHLANEEMKHCYTNTAKCMHEYRIVLVHMSHVLMPMQWTIFQNIRKRVSTIVARLFTLGVTD